MGKQRNFCDASTSKNPLFDWPTFVHGVSLLAEVLLCWGSYVLVCMQPGALWLGAVM